MTTAREWSTWIKLFSLFIIIGGVLALISSFLNEGGIAFNWPNFVLGVLYIVVGARGYHAGIHYSARDARQYYRGIVTIIFFLVVIHVIGIIVNQVSQSNGYCIEYNTRNPNNKISCHTFKNALLAAGLVSLFVSVTCCSACAYCARAYYYELIREEEGYYTAHFSGATYQYPPTNAAPTYYTTTAAPPPYFSQPPTTHHVGGYQQI